MNCTALVLRTQSYGEADLIVDLFTEQCGRVRVIARGALKSRRRYMGVLEPGALVKVDYPLKPGLPTLGPCDVVSSHRRLRQEMSALRQLYYILELLLTVTPEGERDTDLFRSAVELLSALESAVGLSPELLYAWELRLLSHLGYHLRIERCPYTQEAPDGISYQDGGAISSTSGRPHWPVQTQTLRTLYRLQRCGDDVQALEGSISAEEDRELRRAFAGLWSEITGRVLKSEQVFRQLERAPLIDPLPSLGKEGWRTSQPTQPSLSQRVMGYLWIVLLCGWSVELTACQGIEMIPSQASFEVRSSRPARDQSSLASTDHEGAPHHAESLPHLSSHPQGLPQDLDQLTQALRSNLGSVSVELNTRSQRQGHQAAKIYCEFTPSLLSAALFASLTQEPIQLKSAQSKLWLEQSAASRLKSHFSSKERLTKFLEETAASVKSSQGESPLFVPYHPAREQGGAWIVYFPPQGAPQSLILAKNAPWICERAWKIAECEASDSLKKLTYLPLNLQRQLTSPLQLVLVSAEVHTHPIDD